VQFGKHVLLDAPLNDTRWPKLSPNHPISRIKQSKAAGTDIFERVCMPPSFLPSSYTHKRILASRRRLINTPDLNINLFVKMVGYNASPMSSDELEHALHPFYPVGAIIKG
jgi:hypothetical protein